MEPQLADNIGMVARAMANFGLDDLRLIAPRDGWPNEKARIAASGANYIIDDAVDFPTLDAAIGDLQLGGRHHRAPARLEKARADPDRGRRRDAPRASTAASAAACCSGASAAVWRPARSPTPTRSS